jgi:phosphoadenosine phosphosulfate reductase
MAIRMKHQIPLWQQQFQNDSPEKLLVWFCDNFPGAVTFSTSFSVEDQVILHILVSNQLDVRVFTLDTGRLFPETYDLIDLVSKKYNIRIFTYFPDTLKVEQMINSKGINLFYDSVENRRECCTVRKTEPLTRAQEGMKVWVTGMRKDQSVTRNDMDLISWEEKSGMIKVNPLINWSLDRVMDYLDQYKVPFNPLHKRGYSSIGCAPCTRAVMPGEDIRAGRWWWEHPENRECGLHK